MRAFARIQNKVHAGGVYGGVEWRDLVSEATTYRCEFTQINSVETLIANANTAVSYAKIVLRPVSGLSATSRFLIDGAAWDVTGEPKQKTLRTVEVTVKREVAG